MRAFAGIILWETTNKRRFCVAEYHKSATTTMLQQALFVWYNTLNVRESNN
jgi:hypothetical protein